MCGLLVALATNLANLVIFGECTLIAKVSYTFVNGKQIEFKCSKDNINSCKDFDTSSVDIVSKCSTV